MATFPFAPYATYANNSVPKVTAQALNAGQDVDNAAVWKTYLSRPEVKMSSQNGADVEVAVSPLVIFDTPLGKHTYCAFPSKTLTPADLDVAAASWPPSAWVYVYAFSESRVGKFEASATAPAVIMPAVSVVTATKLFKTGDESRRYVGRFWSNGASVVRRFVMLNFGYTYLDQEIALAVDTSVLPGWAAYTAIDLSTFVGADALSAKLMTRMIGNANAFDVLLELSPDSGATPIVGCEVEPDSAGAYLAIKRAYVEMPLLGTTIYGRVSPAVGPAFRLEVNGWTE